MATEAAPGGYNEDFVGSTAGAVVVLDGAGLSGVDDGGCRHGVAWYTRRLGALLLAGLADADASLPAVLAAAITELADSHRSTCDLFHAGSPSATVAIARVRGRILDHLVLADSVIVIDHGDQVRSITDDREGQIGKRYRAEMDSQPGGSEAHAAAHRAYVAGLRSFRNRPGGFWVASSDPAAADHALVGEIDISDVRAVMLLSDGASRLVDRFNVTNWRAVLDLVAGPGPAALIAAVRRAEQSDSAGARWPRGKVHDDATVAYCDQLQGTPRAS